ncbi:MAG: hypothetical protein NVS2B14_16730 [Chamaesiphon sp.]
MRQTASNFDPKDLVDFALKDQTEEFKVKVLQLALKAKVEPSDPLFLVLLATGKLEYFMQDCPRTLESVFEDKLQEISDKLTDYEGAALKSQKAAIASAVSSLIVKSKSLQQNIRPNPGDATEETYRTGTVLNFSVSGWKLAGVVLLSLVLGGLMRGAISV